MLVNALHDDGADAMAEEHGWPSAAALRAFLNKGTGDTGVKH